LPPVGDRIPETSWSAPRQTGAPHRSWRQCAAPPPLEAPCRPPDAGSVLPPVSAPGDSEQAASYVSAAATGAQSQGGTRARAASGPWGSAPPTCPAAPAWKGPPSARLHTLPAPGGAPLLRPARLPGRPASAVAAAGALGAGLRSGPLAAALRAGPP